MSCENCDSSPSAMQRALEKIKTEAKNYAIETQQNIAIYKEAGIYYYTDAGTAIRNNYPIIEVLSFYK